MLSARDYINTAKRLGLKYVDGGYNSDFQDAITRTGFVQNHHVPSVAVLPTATTVLRSA